MVERLCFYETSRAPPIIGWAFAWKERTVTVTRLEHDFRGSRMAKNARDLKQREAATYPHTTRARSWDFAPRPKSIGSTSNGPLPRRAWSESRISLWIDMYT